MPAISKLSKTLLPISVAALLLFNFSTPQALSAQEPASTTEKDFGCELIRELRKPFKRVQFLHHLMAERTDHRAAPGGPERMYASIVKVSLEGNNIGEMDRFSVQCLQCHDGIHATGRLIRLRDGETGHRNRGASANDPVHGGHPIGMDYASFSLRKKTLIPITQLSDDIVLVKGKVGCLSCHNPLNSEGKHLNVAMNESRLCLSCHIK